MEKTKGKQDEGGEEGGGEEEEGGGGAGGGGVGRELWRVSGPVCNTIFGRVFALSLRQYLDAFTTGQNVSRGRPWSLKPCLAPNWILILAGFQLFQSFFFN